MTDTPLVGRTIGNGAFSIDRWIMGATSCGRLLGHDRKTSQPVHIGITRPASVTPDELAVRLAYEVPGVARCLFIGTLDAPSGIEDHVIVVEEAGPGKALTQCASDLNSQTRLQVAQQIGHTLVRAERQGIALGGLHPDLVWPGGLSGVSAILAPRFPVLLAVKKKQRMVGGAPWPFSDVDPFIDPMMLNPWHATAAGDVYCFGLLLAWLFGNKHPFAEAAHRGNNARPWPTMSATRSPDLRRSARSWMTSSSRSPPAECRSARLLRRSIRSGSMSSSKVATGKKRR